MSHSTPVYSIMYRRLEKLVELIWLPGTQSMTDDDFKDTLTVFAECGLQHRARRLIIDMREFKHRPGPEGSGLSRRSDRAEVCPSWRREACLDLAWGKRRLDNEECGRHLPQPLLRYSRPSAKLARYHTVTDRR